MLGSRERHHDWPELQRALEQSLLPPDTVTELSPDARSAFDNRLRRDQLDRAESYHLNSSWRVGDPQRALPSDLRQMVRDWYFTTCADFGRDVGGARESLLRQATELPIGPRRAIAPFTLQSAEATLLYGVDLVVAEPTGVWRLLPGTPTLTREAATYADCVDAVAQATAGAAPPLSAFVLLVGVLPRLTLETGDRAYRQMLLDAGAVLQIIRMVLGRHDAPLPFADTAEFLDRPLTAAIGDDGIERMLVSVVTIPQVLS